MNYKRMYDHYIELLKLLDKFARCDFEELYKDYAREIGKDSLTKEEKTAAFNNHIMEQTDDR